MANLDTRKLKSHNSAPEDAERKQKKKAKQDADLPETSEGPEDAVKPLLRRSVRVQQQKTSGVVSTTPAKAPTPSAQPAAEMTGMRHEKGAATGEASEGPEDVVKPLLRRSVRVQQQKTSGVVSTTPAKAAEPSAQPAAEVTGMRPEKGAAAAKRARGRKTQSSRC